MPNMDKMLEVALLMMGQQRPVHRSSVILLFGGFRTVFYNGWQEDWWRWWCTPICCLPKESRISLFLIVVSSRITKNSNSSPVALHCLRSSLFDASPFIFPSRPPPVSSHLVSLLLLLFHCRSIQVQPPCYMMHFHKSHWNDRHHHHRSHNGCSALHSKTDLAWGQSSIRRRRRINSRSSLFAASSSSHLQSIFTRRRWNDLDRVSTKPAISFQRSTGNRSNSITI